MAKTRIFRNFEEYEAWTEQFDGAGEWEEIPTAIDDGQSINCDCFTECKSHKTALRRFGKQFGDIFPGIRGWAESMQEAYENGCSHMCDEDACYSYGIEETMDGYWYIYLNVWNHQAVEVRA